MVNQKMFPLLQKHVKCGALLNIYVCYFIGYCSICPQKFQEHLKHHLYSHIPRKVHMKPIFGSRTQTLCGSAACRNAQGQLFILTAGLDAL